MNALRVLIVTREYPPSLGGMETFSLGLTEALTKLSSVTLIKRVAPNSEFPFTLLILLSKICINLFRKKFDIIYFTDGALAPLATIIKDLTHIPVAITMHGLDITYSNIVYQRILRESIPRLDLVVCISQSSRKECLLRCTRDARICVIPPGIDPSSVARDPSRTSARLEVSNMVGRRLVGKKILLSVGRLIERKGFHWFIDCVLGGRLNETKDLLYIIAGEGPMRSQLETLLERRNLKGSVLLLGKVDDHFLRCLYLSADLLIMPNIRVSGDIEGFGVVALEASLRGLPIVASSVDGVADSVISEVTGILANEKDSDGFGNAIRRLLHDQTLYRKISRGAITHAIEINSWVNIAECYLHAFESVINSAKLGRLSTYPRWKTMMPR